MVKSVFEYLDALALARCDRAQMYACEEARLHLASASCCEGHMQESHMLLFYD